MKFDAIEKQAVLDFLESQMTCVLATNGMNGYPNTATVAFSNTEEFKFVVGTDIHSRKALNIERDQKVALTITDTEKRWTLQLEGDIRRLDAKEFSEHYAEHHHAKLPFTLPFKDISDQANYVIAPVHLKLTEATKQPWKVHEIIDL